MRGNLLDTNIVLLALGASERLSRIAATLVGEGPNVISVVSYWEVAIKSMQGKLAVARIDTWWPDALGVLQAAPLPLHDGHVTRLLDLPALHKDPFDRMLLAQAAAENLTFVTTDRPLLGYATKQLKVLV